jgi:hypothetical protein
MESSVLELLGTLAAVILAMPIIEHYARRAARAIRRRRGRRER